MKVVKMGFYLRRYLALVFSFSFLLSIQQHSNRENPWFTDRYLGQILRSRFLLDLDMPGRTDTLLI